MFKSDNIEELNEIKLKIDEEIQRTRANDKGGQNDQEIKQRLSSLQFVRRRIDLNISNLSKKNFKSKNKKENHLNNENKSKLEENVGVILLKTH